MEADLITKEITDDNWNHVLGSDKYTNAIEYFVSAIKLSKKMFTYGKDNNDKDIRHSSRILQGRAIGCIGLVYEKQVCVVFQIHTHIYI